jgi:hypothetical protein
MAFLHGPAPNSGRILLPMVAANAPHQTTLLRPIGARFRVICEVDGGIIVAMDDRDEKIHRAFNSRLKHINKQGNEARDMGYEIRQTLNSDGATVYLKSMIEGQGFNFAGSVFHPVAHTQNFLCAPTHELRIIRSAEGFSKIVQPEYLPESVRSTYPPVSLHPNDSHPKEKTFIQKVSLSSSSPIPPNNWRPASHSQALFSPDSQEPIPIHSALLPPSRDNSLPSLTCIRSSVPTKC